MPYLFATEEPPRYAGVACQNTHCAKTSTDGAIYRCDECFGRRLHCLDCLNDQHRHLPFHRVRRWKPGPTAHFVPVNTEERGFTLHLGHRGEPCPLSSAGNVQEMDVMHTNGIHSISIAFCGCRNQLRWEQLLENDLFPGTEERPQSAFSFAVLEQFHTFNLVSKTAAQDFNQALMRMTDGAFPTSVPVSRHPKTLQPASTTESRHKEHVPAIWSSLTTVAGPQNASAGRCLWRSGSQRWRTRPSLPCLSPSGFQPTCRLDARRRLVCPHFV